MQFRLSGSIRRELLEGTYYFDISTALEDTALNAGLLLAPAEGFSLRPRAFFALLAKQIAQYAVLDNCR